MCRRVSPLSAATHRTVDGESVGGGLNIVEAARLQSSVFAERYDSISTRGRTIARDGTQRDVNAANFTVRGAASR